MKDIILPEIIAGGIYNSRNLYKNTTFSKNRKTTMFEIELPTENVGISFIDDDNCPIDTNTIICAKPNQTRHTKLPFACYYIHMQLNEGVLYNKLINMPNFIPTTNQEYYHNLFRRILRHCNGESDRDRIILQSLVLDLIYNLETDSIKQNNKKYANSSSKEIIEQIIKHIKNNLTDDLTLDGLSKYASLSPVYLHNLFKTSTGKTLRDFVEEQRIKKAINLLTSTDYTLTKIAFECGFSSQSYFSYVFKRRTKMTPRQYVKKIYDKYEI